MNPKEEKKEEKIIKEEKNRKEIEKYKVGEIGNWIIFPGILGLILLGVFLFNIWANEDSGWYLIVSLIMWGLLVASKDDIEEKWRKRLECKEKIYSEDEKYKWINNGGPVFYEYGYIYTDSKWEYSVYLIAKIIVYPITIVIVGILAILLFVWLGSISIAPTTIIIILLLIIVFNQNKDRE